MNALTEILNLLNNINLSNSIEFVQYLFDNRYRWIDYETINHIRECMASTMSDFVYFRIIERRGDLGPYESRRAYEAIKLHEDELIDAVNESIPWYKRLGRFSAL